MIKELVQFVKNVPSLVKELAVEPKVGLHILIRFDEEGEGYVVNSERYLGKKHGEASNFLKESAARQEAGWMIDTNKCFDLPTKGIHTSSPYCVGFKVAMSKDDKESKERSKVLAKEKPTSQYKDSIIAAVADRLNSYFEKCFDSKFGLDETSKQKAIQFKVYLKSHLAGFLEDINDYGDVGWDEYVIIYREELTEAYKSFQDSYLSGGLFNTSEYNIEFEGEILGTSNFYNGFNSKKPFLSHQTASFDITNRISADEAKSLAEFQTYAVKRLLPSPLPIFIDEPELTEEAIRIFHKSGDRKISHRDIISELWKRNEDLGNYYLLYFSAGAIQDFDFVSKFQYHLSQRQDDGEYENWIIENLTEIREKDKNLLRYESLRSVFDFERIVIRQLFNNALIKIDEKKGDISMRYFDEMDPKYYRPAIYTLLLKYRKSVYDFIYKSMRAGFGRAQFEEVCIVGMLDDLKENRDYAIRSKLNIYFSLYKYFDTNKNSLIMPSKIEEHKALMAKVVAEDSAHFDSDEGYAFGAGQLIYYLLSQSEAGERNHAVLEPFLQKSNHAHFNDAIAAVLLKYKHAIRFDFKRFNQLAGEVLDYVPQKALTELRPFLLAGYFCPNILFQSQKTDSPS